MVMIGLSVPGDCLVLFLAIEASLAILKQPYALQQAQKSAVEVIQLQQ